MRSNRSRGAGSIALLLASVPLLSACAGMIPPSMTTHVHYAAYDVALVEVARPAAVKQRYGAVDTIVLGDSSRYRYEDDLVVITTGLLPAGRPTHVGVQIRNKTSHTIRLMWDEVSFISTEGEADKVMHVGIKFADRNGAQPPSVIPARASISDAAYPNSLVSYREGFYGTYYNRPGEWVHAQLLPDISMTAKTEAGTPSVAPPRIAELAKQHIGKRVGLLLPLEVEGVTNEYTFWFEVKGATAQSTSF